MHKEYLEKLVFYLKKIEVYSELGIPCADYEEGMEKLLQLFLDVRKAGGVGFFIGNGGSAAIAGHMTADFMKNGGMKTYSLYDNSLTTCMGNDYGYEYIFSYPLELVGNEGDLLVAISSSGNSKNIINAIHVAQRKRLKIVTLTGFERNNCISRMGTWNVYVPVSHYGMVESIHNLLLQQIVDIILERGGVCQ